MGVHPVRRVPPPERSSFFLNKVRTKSKVPESAKIRVSEEREVEELYKKATVIKPV